MLFIRPARRKRYLIFDKFYWNMPKVFFYTKWNTIIFETITKMTIFNSNGSFYNFYPNLPKISIIHKMSKNKAFTWNEHLLSTQNGNLQVKSAVMLFYPNQPKTFFNFKRSKFRISKMSKIKTHILEIL